MPVASAWLPACAFWSLITAWHLSTHFPAALIDCAAVFEQLASGTDGGIVIAGDSAGGGLAASLSQLLQGADSTSPLAVVLLSPWVDLTRSSSSYQSRSRTDQLFSYNAAGTAAEMYLQGIDASDALVSPVQADLRGFPRTLVFVSGDEVLLGDGLRLTERLIDAGCEVELRAVPGVQHVWPTLYPDLAESAAALSDIAHFLRPRCDQGA